MKYNLGFNVEILMLFSKNLSCINVALRLFDRSDRESHWRTVTLQCINYTCFPGHGFKMSKKYQNDFSDRCLRSTGSLYEVQWACCVKCSQPCHLHLSDTDGEIRKDVCGQSYCSEDAFMIRHSVCTEPGSTMTWTQRNINAEV